MEQRLVARIMLAQYETPEALENTIRETKAGGFNSVMVMNCRGHCEPAHYTCEQMLARAQLMAAAIVRFRDAGFGVSVNNLATIGMNLSPPSKHDFGIQPLVDPDGQIFPECFCPYDAKFMEYLDTMFGIWAALGPDEIWVDDDFRYKNKAAHCYCPLHLRQMELITGKVWEREELAGALRSAPASSELLRQWSDVQKNGLLNAARCIAHAVRKVNPNIPIGLMGINISMHHYGAEYLGEVARTFNPNGTPLLRPEFAAYSDAERIGWSAYRPLWACYRALGDIYVALPEFETYPGTQFNHSHRVLRMKYAWAAAHGFRHAAESTMWETVRFEPRFSAAQRGNFEVYANIANIVSDETLQTRGVSLELSQDRAGNNGAADILDVHAAAANMVGRLGLPLWPDGGHATFLTGNSPLSDLARWDELAAGGLVIDRTAFDTLLALDETGRIGGATTAPMPGVPAWERFEDVPENGRAAGDINSMETATARRADMPAFVLPDDPRIRVLSWLEDEDGQRLSLATWIFETEQGRIAVLPFSMDDTSSISAIANWKRKGQIESLLEWAARKPLPVKVSGVADLFCVYRETAERDRIVLALANFSQDPATEFTLKIPAMEEWNSWWLRVTDEMGNWPATQRFGEGSEICSDGLFTIQPMAVVMMEIVVA